VHYCAENRLVILPVGGIEFNVKSVELKLRSEKAVTRRTATDIIVETSFRSFEQQANVICDIQPVVCHSVHLWIPLFWFTVRIAGRIFLRF
jgi:hypothetical protein